MNAERWRLFVAVPIGDELRRDLAAAVEEWKNRPDLAGLRWTDPKTWHVTLAFLGDRHPKDLEAIRAAIRTMGETHDGFEMTFDTLGAFPSAASARVVWYGPSHPVPSLASLAHRARVTLSAQSDRPYSPHVTLARARRGSISLSRWLADTRAPTLGWRVDHVELMRSHVGFRSEPRYEIIAAVRLETGSRVARPSPRGPAE